VGHLEVERRKESLQGGKMKRLAVVVLITIIVSSGCGTLFRRNGIRSGGPLQTVVFESEPMGASVIIHPDTGPDIEGKCPLEVDLKSARRYYVSFSKAGFYSKTFNLGKHPAIGIVLIDGPIGIIIDHFTGGLYHLDQQSVSVTLEPKS
jgi:hypothetical protein